MQLRAFRDLSLVGFCGLTLGGCMPGEEKAMPERATVTAAQTKPNATADQWAKSVAGTFDKVNVKQLHDRKNPAYVNDSGSTDENGVSEFFACFDKAPPKCDISASGRRDGFRKVQFFRDPVLTWNVEGAKYAGPAGKTSIDAYISIPDCEEPKLVLRPIYRSDKWLFLDQFGVMADGIILIDKKINRSDIDRENNHNSVSESVHLPLTSDEVAAVRKMHGAKQVLLRLTGQKGYTGIDQKTTKEFIQGIDKSLRIYDALMQSTKSTGPVSDPACQAQSPAS